MFSNQTTNRTHFKQWGFYSEQSYGDKRYKITFPIQFPTMCFLPLSIDLGNGDNSYASGDGGNKIDDFNQRDFSYYTGFDGNRLGALYIAIGK